MMKKKRPQKDVALILEKAQLLEKLKRNPSCLAQWTYKMTTADMCQKKKL